MTALALTKAPNGVLLPATSDDEEFVRRLRVGQVIHADFKRQRNYLFHKKYFALVKFSYDHWEPGALEDPRWKDVVPEKNFDRFRRDLTILAGYYDAHYRLDGSVRIEAKSISFGNMDEAEFEKMYSATINAVLKHVLKNYERDQLEHIVAQLLAFD